MTEQLAALMAELETFGQMNDAATANFARSGLAACISLVHEDAGRVLERSPDAGFDLIFLDSERPAYPGWWPDLKRVLRGGQADGKIAVGACAVIT